LDYNKTKEEIIKRKDMNTTYITTPIYYVNDVPHIGHVEARTQGDAMLPDLVVEVGIRIQRGLAGPVGLYQRGMVEVPDVVGRAVQRPAPVGIILLP